MKITNRLFNTLLFSTALMAGHVGAAPIFDPEAQPLGHIAPIELSTTDISNGGKAYRPWFENGAWLGDLIEYDVSDKGVLTSSIVQTNTGPAQSGTANWSASVRFDANETASATYWDSGRKIITSTTGTNQVAFRWANLSDAQKQLIDAAAFSAKAASSNILDFLRGDRSNEKPGGALRLRFSLLNDIVHSNPVYVGTPEGSFEDSSYIAFKNANLNRAPRVYVGSNTGMLHAFNANNGNEVWSYVPSMLMHKLPRLAGVPYAHTYFVDGEITVRDAFVSGGWQSTLVGSMGAGAKGLFGLNVTSPALSSENLASGTNAKIMWELSADADDDMGYIYGQSTITQLNDGKWYAINGNGVASVNGKAVLYLVELATGTVTRISTTAGSAGAPNGLSPPALVDIDGDGMDDVAYAGDIDGDLWKFDLSATSSAGWKVAYKLYDGSDTQAITTRPDVTLHPSEDYLVMFATGRLFTDDDIFDKSVQSIIGVWDRETAPSGSETRLVQLLSEDDNFNGGGYSEKVRTFTTTTPIDYTVDSGWQVDLPPGERVVTTPLLRAGRLKAAVVEPESQTNWLLEVTFDEGGVADNSIFDLDRNGKLNNNDRVDGNVDGDLEDLEDIPMAWEGNSGSMSRLTVANLGGGFDTLLQNNLNPQFTSTPDTCTGSCTGGLTGGHMDVDTDAGSNNGLAGGTNGHVHEYDDKYDVTYVDYFDMEGEGKLTAVTDVGISGSEEFIVVVANADLSPGAILILDNKEYSVVSYQRMIHKKLANWNGNPNTLKDDDGRSLVFTLDQIKATMAADPDAIGLRQSFDNLAIIGGGLVGTQTGCVNKSSAITNGRWRNGSLIFQMVKASHFAGLGGASALDRLVVQTPTDLKAVIILSDGTQVELTEDLNNDTKIDGTTPAYEVYGGLVARNNAEFLYESTLFWHFGEVAKEYLGVKPCYGDPDWEEAFRLETQGVSPEVYDDLLEDAGFEDFAELAAFVESLESCKDTKTKEGGCQDAFEEVEDLYNQGLLVENAKNGNNGGGSGSPGSGTTIEGTIQGDTSKIEGEDGDKLGAGTNYSLGRRTWIDILPE